MLPTVSRFESRVAGPRRCAKSNAVRPSIPHRPLLGSAVPACPSPHAEARAACRTPIPTDDPRPRFTLQRSCEHGGFPFSSCEMVPQFSTGYWTLVQGGTATYVGCGHSVGGWANCHRQSRLRTHETNFGPIPVGQVGEIESLGQDLSYDIIVVSLIYGVISL
jgi:hypothetical protein